MVDPGAALRRIVSKICGSAGMSYRLIACIVVSCASIAVYSQDKALLPAVLKKMTVEELLNLEVSLVSRTPEKLTEAASAIQVITGEDIRNSGATNIPEALRLVTNLQVAQLNSNAWIISSRGFNTIFANKLLVMIDGRTVYTPLFGGVLWELQNVLMEDIDKIEVVSGPGGTLWGANAVNGVINIVSKKTKDTQGLYAMALAGTYVKDQFSLRYGGKAGKGATYKVYARHYNRNPTIKPDSTDNQDEWRCSQAGFRIDWGAAKDQYTVQGDYYGGSKFTPGGNSDFNGQNVLGRWAHIFNPRSNLVLQLYYDRYLRDDIPAQAKDIMSTYDMDGQYHIEVSAHNILVGAGSRIVYDHVDFKGIAGILPPKKRLDLFNVFAQDEITLSPKIKMTLGSKLLHNVYTHFEVQPSARLTYSAKTNKTLWASVSRAVRTPSRFDVDYYLPVTLQPPNVPSVAGGPHFISEKLVACELGYRMQPNTKSSFSVAGFYNVYSDVYSVEALPGTLTYQVQNGSRGRSWGGEFAGTYQVTSAWRMRAGYTYYNKKLEPKPGHIFDPVYLGNDARNQVLLHSMTDFGKYLHFDFIGRYLDYLPATMATAQVDGYFTFDAKLAFNTRYFELSFVGQNLYKKYHSEFDKLMIPRGVYGKLICRI